MLFFFGKRQFQRAFGQVAVKFLAPRYAANPDARLRFDREARAMAAVLKDEKTVTARHTLQSIWRVGLAGDDRRAQVLDALAGCSIRILHLGGQEPYLDLAERYPVQAVCWETWRAAPSLSRSKM